jgi:hypothetical protein
MSYWLLYSPLYKIVRLTHDCFIAWIKNIQPFSRENRPFILYNYYYYYLYS